VSPPQVPSGVTSPVCHGESVAVVADWAATIAGKSQKRPTNFIFKEQKEEVKDLLVVVVTLAKDGRDGNTYICELDFTSCHIGTLLHEPSNPLYLHFLSANSEGSS
jgi:hypothetical protein